MERGMCHRDWLTGKKRRREGARESRPHQVGTTSHKPYAGIAGVLLRLRPFDNM